jgi:hypothetical protein
MHLRIAYFLAMASVVACNGGTTPDFLYSSTVMHTRTNASSVMRLATNMWSHTGAMDKQLAGQLMVELGNLNYAPAALWLGQHGDPEAKIGILLQSGYRNGKSFATIRHPSGEIKTYEGSNPMDERRVYWLRKAADQRYAEAQYELGKYFAEDFLNAGRQSNGTEDASAREAFKWYGLAAAQGDLKAKHALGTCYIQGIGVQQNWPMAMQLYEQCGAFYDMAKLALENTNHVAAYTWWCVGNERQNKILAPFTSEYAVITFSAAERTTGAQRAAAYLQQHATSSSK